MFKIDTKHIFRSLAQAFVYVLVPSKLSEIILKSKRNGALGHMTSVSHY
jgi:hypothetical protein